MKKLKTYVLMLSKTFPATHTRAGEETGFAPKMMAAIDGMPCFHKKLHTIRGNYELWQQRFNKIMAGEAVLSVRAWVGKPYGKGSTVREIVRLTAEDGIGLQQVYLDSITPIIGDRLSIVKLTGEENYIGMSVPGKLPRMTACHTKTGKNGSGPSTITSPMQLSTSRILGIKQITNEEYILTIHRPLLRRGRHQQRRGVCSCGQKEVRQGHCLRKP